MQLQFDVLGPKRRGPPKNPIRAAQTRRWRENLSAAQKERYRLEAIEKTNRWREQFKARDPEGFKIWLRERHQLLQNRIYVTRDLDAKKRRILVMVKARAKQRGIYFNITVADITWPERCPVLNIPLDYFSTRACPESVSLDRWDNTKGYIPGNVFVISHKANALKSNGTADELMRVATYAANGLKGV